MSEPTLPGLSISKNALNFCAVRLHYSADPEKNPLHSDPKIRDKAQIWLDRVRAFFPDPNVWNQEMEISFWVASGTRVFPEFSETIHCQALEHRGRKVIYRAWDFGWHAPVCVLAQIDAKDRLICLHEVVGNQETTAQFASKVIDRCAEWYPRHTAGFEDFCDPAGQQASTTANEKGEKRDIEVLQGLGIHPSWEFGWSRKDGRSLIHQLLRVRTDGTPSIYVDQTQCPVLVQGFLGKFVYPESKDGRIRDEPDEGNHPWSDAQAALRYMATGLYSTLGLRRLKYMPVIQEDPDYMGYGTPKRKRK
jgi:hypothetical protein